ncbi:Cof-type HAD-IIB family hydrolase [Alkalithermobacter paradoxus]|uniref:Putative phosphatase YwpJ n=1 Tax=Alkalithermobacter paradoxus TaxID=29349 RepID=A0A1V4I8B7_9FIRM|nr:putative phosphatase YwpJ [[Clostridium] thermoalcaliphilum]
MKYKLIVTDMDGTLLNSKNEVSEKNKLMLKKAQDMGIKVAIATGRIYTSARHYAKLLGIKTPIIACNGAIIRESDTGKTIYENILNEEDSIKIIELCEKHGVYYHFYDDEGFYCKELAYSSLLYNEWNEAQPVENRINIKVVDDSKSVIKNGVNPLKFLIIDEDADKLNNLKKELEQIQTLEISKSWHNNIEVMNKGACKGLAVKRLSQYLNIKQDEIIALGDNYNDLSMIEYAGVGVAMGNAEKIVKEKSNYITTSNDEDGVANALQNILDIV